MNANAPILPRYLLYIVVGLVAYASLYPFVFHFNALERALAGDGLDVMRRARSGLIDIVANVCFYVPLGFVLCARRRSNSALLWRLLGYSAAGAALSTLMEVLQFAVPTRQPSLIDIETNTAGTLLGALLALAMAQTLPTLAKWQWLRSPQPDRMAYLLVVLWLALKGAPFIPRLDLQRISQSLATLHSGEWSIAGAIESFAAWLIVLTALRLSFQRQYFWRAAGALLVYALLAQLLFRQHSLKPDDLLGAAGALLLIGLTRRQRTDTTMPMVFACTQLSIVLSGLSPYRFVDNGKRFLWIPFSGSLDSAYQSAPFAMLLKLLLYGGCLWAATRAGFTRRASTLIVLLTVTAVEAAQIYLPGRVAEITDPLLVLALALLMSIPALGVQRYDRKKAEPAHYG